MIVFVAQRYDGAAVMSGENGGLHPIIKQPYQCANFVHSYTHQLQLIV
jgi:hypothetical protein